MVLHIMSCETLFAPKAEMQFSATAIMQLNFYSLNNAERV